jgi:hypothetical protein
MAMSVVHIYDDDEGGSRSTYSSEEQIVVSGSFLMIREQDKIRIFPVHRVIYAETYDKKKYV